MGAWAAGSFENDDAGDWVCELPDALDTSVLKDAFTHVIDSEDNLEAPDCSVAIAAAEVVAAMRQHPGNDVPEQVGEFVSRMEEPPTRALVDLALKALKRVRTKSELQEYWDENEKREDWHQALAELEGRLR